MKFPLNNSCKAFKLNDLKEYIKRSKIPVISAMVPPETPGMMLPTPIARPLKNKMIYSLIFYDNLPIHS